MWISRRLFKSGYRGFLAFVLLSLSFFLCGQVASAQTSQNSIKQESSPTQNLLPLKQLTKSLVNNSLLLVQRLQERSLQVKQLQGQVVTLQQQVAQLASQVAILQTGLAETSTSLDSSKIKQGELTTQLTQTQAALDNERKLSDKAIRDARVRTWIWRDSAIVMAGGIGGYALQKGSGAIGGMIIGVVVDVALLILGK